jgi:hypothetical protein
MFLIDKVKKNVPTKRNIKHFCRIRMILLRILIRIYQANLVRIKPLLRIRIKISIIWPDPEKLKENILLKY